MTQPNVTQPATTEERARQAAEEAHAKLLRQAEQQGVRPLRFDELLGDSTAGDLDKEDVDAFLRLRSEQRESERARMRE